MILDDYYPEEKIFSNDNATQRKFIKDNAPIRRGQPSNYFKDRYNTRFLAVAIYYFETKRLRKKK
jgi:hypothetical protein